MTDSSVLTTGQVAKICKVAPRTVSKWFDRGQLEGYKIPGSRDRRIPLNQLIKFMKQNGMPVDEVETNQRELTLVIARNGPRRDAIIEGLSGQADVVCADSLFEAGRKAERYTLRTIVIDWTDFGAQAEQSAGAIRETRPGIKIVAVGDVPTQTMVGCFDAHVASHTDTAGLLRAITTTTTIGNTTTPT